ncbi:MAG: hypothetical protein CL609_17470 [Anaerolineaceae bacterium]|nr:hypothetical protein [Anaerolineaceae bacterium]
MSKIKQKPLLLNDTMVCRENWTLRFIYRYFEFNWLNGDSLRKNLGFSVITWSPEQGVSPDFGQEKTLPNVEE